MSARRGVTLIELVVVLAIIGIVAGVAAPAFLSSARAPVSGAQSVATLVTSARMRAIEQGRVVTLTIDPISKRFWVDAPDTSGTLDLPDGVSLRGDPRVHFLFRPSGESSADQLTIEEKGTLRSVRVDRWTGEVSAR